jgi:hypothetical protein
MSNVQVINTEPQPEKVCTKCGKTLPATREYFSPHPTCRYGVTSYCKDCDRNGRRNRRVLDGDHLRQTPMAQAIHHDLSRQQRRRDIFEKRVRVLAAQGPMTEGQMVSVMAAMGLSCLGASQPLMRHCHIVPWVTVEPCAIGDQQIRDSKTCRHDYRDGDLCSKCDQLRPLGGAR